MIKKDYYKILNVHKSADEKTIKKAYKRLALKYHPDHNNGDKIAEEKFKEIKEAYEVLIDPKKKYMYDNYGFADLEQNAANNKNNNNYYTQFHFGDIFSDIFGDIFGSKTSRKPHHGKSGDNLTHVVELSLEEVFRGVTKNIHLNYWVRCPQCSYSGCSSPDGIQSCPHCRGRGSVEMKQGFFFIKQNCNMCFGEGVFITNPCKLCKGEGRVLQSKTLNVTFPPGIDNNHIIKFPGEGNAGIRGGRSGDLFIKVKIKDHAIFKRKENDLYCVIPISIFQAVLGGEIEVPTLHHKIKVKIPAGTQTNKTFRIKGKGIQAKHTRGDLLCKIIIVVPVNLNEQQINKFKELESTLLDPLYFPKIKK